MARMARSHVASVRNTKASGTKNRGGRVGVCWGAMATRTLIVGGGRIVTTTTTTMLESRGYDRPSNPPFAVGRRQDHQRPAAAHRQAGADDCPRLRPAGPVRGASDHRPWPADAD